MNLHLDLHIRKHLGNSIQKNKNYGMQWNIHECELCNFQTIDMEDLKQHIDQHM